MPADQDLDVVQHPTLGTLKFPKAMPPDERNASIDRALLSRPDLQAPPGVSKPNVEMKEAIGGGDYERREAAPGSFEGHPENVGEYVPASAGQVVSGAADIGRGDIARGGHKIIGGLGNAMLPAAPFMAAAAPWATARAIALGTAGGGASRGIASELGATPDQADLAGDVGTIVSGGIGAKPKAAISPLRAPASRTLNALGDSVDPDIVGIASPRIAHGIRLAKKWGKAIEPQPTVKADAISAAEGLPEVEAAQTETAQHLQRVISDDAEMRNAANSKLPRSEGLPEVEEGQAAAGEHLQRAITPNPQRNARLDLTPRRLPGEVPAESSGRISAYDFVGQRAPAIPTREGLMLRGEVAPPPAELPEAFRALPSKPKLPSVSGTADLPFKAPARAIETSPVNPPAIDTSRATVGQLLNKATDAQPLTRGIPLKDQAASSVIDSHSYNPAVREMTVSTKNGSQYVHGDVSPEQAQAFEQAESKGKAWNELRNNSTLVAKIVDGKRVAIKPPKAIQSASPNDLTTILEESVKQAKTKK